VRLLSRGLSNFFSSGWRLIAVAALLHVTLAVGLFWAGRAQIAPGLLDRDAIFKSFAPDSYAYQREAIRLTSVLRDRGLRAWLEEPERPHIKLISLQFAIFSSAFGHSTLSAEPLNLFSYIAILCLVLTLGREVAGMRVGLCATGIVALWPTFLMHTTQFLKDPLFIAGALALILIVTMCLTRTCNWVGAVSMSALIALMTALLLSMRGKFGAIIFALAFFGFILLSVRQWLQRRLLYWNLTCLSLLLIIGALAAFDLTGHPKPKRYPSDQSGDPKTYFGPGRHLTAVIADRRTVPFKAKVSGSYKDHLEAATERTALEIGLARHRINVNVPEASSAIDPNVELSSPKDMIDYLPRAFAIGLWAPFPKMWVSAGASVGRTGRLIAGAETLVIYLCELFTVFAIWRAPRCLAAWLLLLIIILGVAMLGLVVSNVGTLYRFRYLFWILLIILGLKGLQSVGTTLRQKFQPQLISGGLV